LHFEHGAHDSLRLLMVWIAQHLAQDGWVDLPGQTIFVFEPAARPFLSARREFLPELVDFALRLAVYRERDGLVEFELRAAVQRYEWLPVEIKLHGHDAAGRAGPCFSVAGNVDNL